MVDKKVIQEAVRDSLKEKLAPNKEVQITEEQKQQIQDTMIEEGFGRAFAKALVGVGGATLGGSIGGNIGAAMGGVGTWILSAMGLVSASTILPAAIVGATGGGLYLMYHGAKFGMRVVDTVNGSDSDKISVKIAEVTEKRDELMQQAAKDPDQSTRYTSKIDRLTKEQMKYAKDLEKSLKRDQQMNAIDMKEYQAYKKIIDVAKNGKLTYIKK